MPRLTPLLTQRGSATLETYQNFFERLGELAPEGAWIARYQVRQPQKAYWYYKLQASSPTFTTTTETPKLSKYKHLGKAGSEAHVEAVMGVARRTIVEDLQKTIDSLKSSLRLYFFRFRARRYLSLIIIRDGDSRISFLFFPKWDAPNSFSSQSHF